jgi:hypothetical protein
MKDLETVRREETREPVEPIFSSAPETTTQSIQSESGSHFEITDTFVGREAYRLSPLSEW